MSKITRFIKTILLSVVLCTLINCTNNIKTSNSNFLKIQADFKIPKDDNTLWCYWYWIGDDISKEGITKDLEAMKKAGIGAALIGNINPSEKDGKVPMLSESWWNHMVHAVNEGKRIGVDIGVFNCPGWSQSGGPWVKPNMAMRYMTYSETSVTGGKPISIKLEKPKDEFQDSYVLAFPSMESEKRVLSSANSKITSTPNLENPTHLIDKDTSNTVTFSKTVKDYCIDIVANEPIQASSLKIFPGNKTIDVDCDVLYKTESGFKLITSFKIFRVKLDVNVGPDKYAPILIGFPSITSNHFRLHFKLPENTDYTHASSHAKSVSWDLAEITLSEASGLSYYAEKNLSKMHPTPFPEWDSYIWEQQDHVPSNDKKIALNKVLDISDKMNTQGNLVWNAPEGQWTIQRFGMTPTGTKNAPSAPQGKGYEIDKANKELVQFHYNQFIGELLKRIPEESKSAFKYVVADSYEMGSQNWTDNFEQTFEAKFGYSPKKYLPVFSGRIVGSVEESERFLWDLRRSIADAVAYEYTGGLREASNKDHLQLWLENYGHWGFPSEFLMYGGQSDLVSGEFWNEGTLGNIECKSASSAAHIYGKPRVSAEAFTAANRTYVRHPAMLKKRGDWSYTEGINHFVLHVYIHQPDNNRVPGVNAWFSTEFNRHNTWFEKGKAYFDYLRRCQYLLQQGKYAADVCYFIGENTPIMTGTRNPDLPNGYSYDYINAEVILNKLTVKNRKFVLPNGMTYSLMVLPPFDTMRPELLTKIEALVKQGGNIYGIPPKKSPSLQNYPESDKQVEALASKMWNSSTNNIKPYGNGYIINSITLQEALTSLNITKDVDLQGAHPVLWTHRSLPEMDIYFLTNQSDQEIAISPSFRVNGLKPQLWDAITGTINPLPEFTEKDGRTMVPIKMKAHQSWFVVFSNTNIKTSTQYDKNFPKSIVLQTLEAPWTVDFKNKEIGPKTPLSFPVLSDWITSSNDSIKFYSGTAVYKSEFNFSKKDALKDIFIDLGKVGVMASVKINGKDIGTTWMAPFRLIANNALKNGKNQIEIEVVNVWRNRLTGDKTLPKENKTTWISVDKTLPEEALIPSGLLGPVTIQTLQ